MKNLSQNEVVQRLLDMERGVAFLSAPSGGGKTAILHKLQKLRPGCKVISSETFIMGVVEDILKKGTVEPVPQEQDLVLCIEDLDWYKGREATQQALALWFAQLRESGVVIVTGIDLENRLPALFRELKADYGFVRKSLAHPWECVCLESE